MIHYHGTPCGGKRAEAARFLTGRHALVSFALPEDMPVVADVCQSFVLDNGAFTAWKQGAAMDVPGYVRFVREWHRHPGFDWCLIPDVIEGSEAQNDALIAEFLDTDVGHAGVPVWHMHESIDRLVNLAERHPRVALGSSGAWKTPGAAPWWVRIKTALAAICDSQGRPICRLHGLRMLDPRIFQYLPLASADSTNAVVNAGSLSRFGMYIPPTGAQRAEVMAARIEMHNSAPILAATQEQIFA